VRESIKRHWKSKFARFIQSYGVEVLALNLDVHPTAIYHWVRGATTPRPACAEVIQRLARESGFTLTMDDIYAHSRAVQAEDVEPRTVVTTHSKSKFALFIQSYGLQSLALELQVRHSSICYWIRGASAPRQAHAEVIQRLARERGFTLTMDDIYGRSRQFR
jgi:hypothetical protein